MNPSWQLRCAVRVLCAGGLVLHATEGVWGLACDPLDASAVARLLRTKQRALDKGLLLIGADADDFAPELSQLTAAQRARVRSTWPGAVTWVLPSQRFPAWITGVHESIAGRVPGHAQARSLAGAFGRPLVSTSANLSGQVAPRHALLARRAMGTLVDYVLPGETLSAGVGANARGASEIRTLTGTRLR